MTLIDEQALLQRAIAAYYRYCKRNGLIASEPSTSSEVQAIDGKVFTILRNVRGIIRIYEVEGGGLRPLDAERLRVVKQCDRLRSRAARLHHVSLPSKLSIGVGSESSVC